MSRDTPMDEPDQLLGKNSISLHRVTLTNHLGEIIFDNDRTPNNPQLGPPSTMTGWGEIFNVPLFGYLMMSGAFKRLVYPSRGMELN